MNIVWIVMNMVEAGIDGIDEDDGIDKNTNNLWFNFLYLWKTDPL